MDDDDLAEAYESYMPAVYARCRRILRQDSAALDATQEVFMRVLKHKGQLRAGPELLHWLYRVATNVCLNVLRRQRSEVNGAFHLASAEAAHPDESGPRGVMDMLRGLDERTQTIAIYVHLDGMTHTEAANLAGVSDRTVRNCLARVLAHCQRHLGMDAVQFPHPPKECS